MGAVLSSFFGGSGRTDDPDQIGLTSKDKILVQATWGQVRKKSTDNGVALLILLFEKYPEEQQHFPFKDLSISELKTDKKFAAHCNDVMYAVSSIVDNLGDPELVVSILEKIGKKHKWRNVKPISFEHVKEVMLDMFKGFMAKEAVEAWDKTLKIAFSVIEKELQ